VAPLPSFGALAVARGYSIMTRGLSAVAAAATALTLGCSSGGATEASERAPAAVLQVKATKVRQEEIRWIVEVVGSLAGAEEVTVSAEVEGTASAVVADLGDHVRAGQPLVELDREKLEYRLQERKAALGRTLARYGAEKPTELPPIETTPAVQKAAAELAEAERAWKRAEELERRQLVSRQQRDEAEARLRSATALHQAALHEARNLRSDIDAARAKVQLAERELADATVRAPFDGYVQRRHIGPGQYVRAETPVATLVKMDPLKALVEVPERLAPWIAVGQPVKVRVEAYPGQVFRGTVARISPAINPQSRAFPLEASIKNPDRILKPGAFVRVELASSRVDRILTMPTAGLQYRYGINRAFVVEKGTIHARELRIGDRLGERVEILEGVKPGDRVVVSDIEKLTEGARVEAVDLP
jgi:membrane fusion protein, multidrug efflux system